MFHVISIILSKKLFFQIFQISNRGKSPFVLCFQISNRGKSPFVLCFQIPNRGKSPFVLCLRIPWHAIMLPFHCIRDRDYESCCRHRHRGPISNRGPKIFKTKKISKFKKTIFLHVSCDFNHFEQNTFFSNFPNFQSKKIAFRTLLPNFQSREIAFRTLLTDPMTCDHVTVPLHQRPWLRIVLPSQDIAVRLATVVRKFSKW